MPRLIKLTCKGTPERKVYVNPLHIIAIDDRGKPESGTLVYTTVSGEFDGYCVAESAYEIARDAAGAFNANG